MGTYRLYCLDGAGNVASAQWLDAADDEAAMASADRLRGRRSCELWQGDRLVGRVGPSKR